MKYMILILAALFLAMGHSAAQRADTIRAKYYVEGRFYKELPKGFLTKHKVRELQGLADSTGHNLWGVVLQKGEHLSEAERQQAIPDNQVFSRETILSSNEFYSLVKGSELKVGTRLPDFSVKDNKGRVWTNKDLEGKPVVLNFWYTGCGPCIKEMPELAEWVTRYPKALCLAVTYQPAKLIDPIVTRRGFTFHQLVEAKDFWTKMGVHKTPTTFIVDKTGIIRQIIVGTNEQKRKSLEDTLKELSNSL